MTSAHTVLGARGWMRAWSVSRVGWSLERSTKFLPLVGFPQRELGAPPLPRWPAGGTGVWSRLVFRVCTGGLGGPSVEEGILVLTRSIDVLTYHPGGIVSASA